ncbi:uncharacterized protein LOC135392320 [Ornithodoros turicata]|uniref:uncharacterized protein LOC135392320 n=1 Tax=Ornithodoros turicata TaxID=34597 RepID=UPI003138D135
MIPPLLLPDNTQLKPSTMKTTPSTSTPRAPLATPATAAPHFWIPALSKTWMGHLDCKLSSTAAELVSIQKALEFVDTLHPQKVTIFSDSKCALQRLQKCYPDDHTSSQIIDKTLHLKRKGFHVLLHWIPSHVGIEGNEIADSLASTAHNLPPDTSAPYDSNANRSAFANYIQNIKNTAFPGVAKFSQPLPTKDLSR